MAAVQIWAQLNRNGAPDAPAYACTSYMVLPRVSLAHRDWGTAELKIPVAPLMAVLGWLLREPSVVMTAVEREEYARDMRVCDEEIPEVDYLESLEMLADVLRCRLLDCGSDPIVFADDLALHAEGQHQCLQRDAVDLRVKFIHPAYPKVFVEGVGGAEYDHVSECLNVQLEHGVWSAPESPDDIAHIQLEFKFGARAPYTISQDAQLHHFASQFNSRLQPFCDAMDVLSASRLRT